jgi:hypothetical protein
MSISLYIKETPSGLMYLGKTITDPYTYTGSGTVWMRHLRKHKYNKNDISTMVIYVDDNKERFSFYAKKVSEKLRVIESDKFANLTNEEGQGGNTYHCISEDGKKRFHAAAFQPKSESHRKAIGISSTGRPGHNPKAVCQYDMDWNLIATHKSLAEACRSLGKKGNSGSEIKIFIDGGRWKKNRSGKMTYIKYNHAFGYKWSYYVTK